MITAIRQLAAVTLLGLRTIPDRLGASLVVVVGMACVVGVFISILSMSTGYMEIVAKTGHSDRAVVLSQGALFEYVSFISRGNALTIADASGVKKTADGKAIVSADSLAFVVLPKKRDGLDAYVSLRGVGSEGLALRPEVKLISGRMFNAGAHELIVGKAAQAEFDGLAIAKLAIPLVRNDIPGAGIVQMPWVAVLTGLALALVVAFVSGVLPALRAKRLSIVDALAGR